MEFVIGGLIVIVAIVIVSLILRKKLYGRIDYYEDWKLDIMNRSVANELAKVKELKLEGETKDRFEHWKNEWEVILNEDMADVEELLYDTEKAADRYQFPSAKKYMSKMEEKMVRAEEKIEKVLEQLDGLLDIEKANRKNVAEILPKLDDLRKYISRNQYQYNRAGIRFDVEMDDILAALQTYDNLAEEGNYTEGAKIITEMKERTNRLAQDIEEFPVLYKKSKETLPKQLDDLAEGIVEMTENGYHVEHLKLNKEISDYQVQLLDLVKELEEEGTGKVKEMLPEIEIRIKEMYDLLEREALAKNYVDSKIPNYEQALDSFSIAFSDTKSQVDQLKETYYFEDSDLEKYLSLEKKLHQLKDQLQMMHEKVTENHAHTNMRSELETAFNQLETLEKEHDAFREGIQTLRKDELEAREQMQKMYEDMHQMNREIKNSNLPGIPNFIWKMLDNARDKNEQVLSALDKHPLDIMEVNQALEQAKDTVNTAIDQTSTTIEQAYLTEHVIQYANRYRSSYPILNGKLVEAERLFRNAEYELSLEKAARALEEIEPGALKKVERYQELTVS